MERPGTGAVKVTTYATSETVQERDISIGFLVCNEYLLS